MANSGFPSKRVFSIVIALCVFFLVAILIPQPAFFRNIPGFLPLHMAMDTFAVLVSLLVFFVGWNANENERSCSLLILSSAFLAVGLLDFLHLLSFPGMPVFITANSVQETIYFWFAARIMATSALVAVAILPARNFTTNKPRYAFLFAGLSYIALVFWLVIFHENSIPAMYVEGKGFTSLKVISEYLLAAANILTAIILFVRSRSKPQPFDINGLFAAAIITSLSELFRSRYLDTEDVFNFFGHLYKVIAYIFIYKAVFVFAVRLPFTRLRESKEALRASEERFRLLVNSVEDYAIFMLDTEGRIVSWNEGAERLYGYKADEISGKHFSIFYEDDDLKNDKPERKLEIAANEGRYEEEGYRVGKDGTRYLVNAVITGVRDDEGILRGFAKVTRDITERKQAEKQIQESEIKFRMLAESSGSAILLHRDDGQFIYVNPAAERMTGYTRNELLSLKIWDLLHPDFRETVEQRLRARLEGENILAPNEVMMVVKSGETRWIAYTAGRVLIDETPAIIAMATDMTERKHAEEALLKEKFITNTAIDSTPGIFYLYNEQRQFLRWNHNFERISGYSAEEITQMHPLDFFADEEKLLLEERIAEVFAKGESSVEASFVSKNGTITPFFFTGKRVLLNQTLCLVGMGIDITKRKRVEEELLKSMEGLRLAYKAAGIGAWDWDMTNDEISWSPEYYEVFGLNPLEVKPSFENFIESIIEQDREYVQNTVRRVVEERKDLLFEYRINHSQKGLRWIQGIGKVTYDENQKPIRMVGIVMDVTEHKRSEQQIINSREQMRALTAHLQKVRENERTLIAREVHDVLGQLLTALKIDFSMCVKKLHDIDKEGVREKIINRVGEMKDLIDEIIKSVQHISAELRPGVLDTLGLVAAIEWQSREFEKRTEIECKCNLPQTSVEISSEKATAMFRIFQEVLTNVARHSRATKIDVDLYETDGAIFLKVKDNGRGITDEELADTSSLGLLGMRERARIFGGDVIIQGEKGKGTQVLTNLPIGNAETIYFNG